mmetsp:Transcript_12002/g.18411  ORF Transcript_12002/g.18411 Transcript_12002/m.18411 type:complete len:331 (-) Transcript_12002:281-1273(-)
MTITHRRIVTAHGGSSPHESTETNDDTTKHLSRKHSTVPAVTTLLLICLGLLTPIILFGRRHRDMSSSHLRQPIYNINDDGQVPPKDWQQWGYFGFRKNFNCDEYLNDATKPVPDMEYWDTMLEVYNRVVDPTYKFDDEVPPTEGYRLNENGAQPYYAKLSPDKGRGLFASRDIQKGEIIHDGNKSDIVFPDGLSWKRFMVALPRKMACDQSEWTFTQRFEEGGPMRVASSLNIAILMNEGNTLEEVNVQPEDGNGNPSEYSVVFYAMRDIKKDEEILMDYSDYDTNYVAAGIGYQPQKQKATKNEVQEKHTVRRCKYGGRCRERASTTL